MWEQGYFGFVPETRYGSAITPTSYFFPCRVASVTKTIHPYKVLAQGMNPPQSTFGSTGVDLTAQVSPQPEMVRHFLSALFGECKGTQLAPGVAQYEFRPSTARKSYTVEVRYKGLVRQAVGTYLTSLAFQVAPTNPVMMSMTGVARDVKNKASTTIPVYVAEEGAWWDKTSFQVSGVDESQFVSATVTIQAPVLALDSQAASGKVANYLASAPCETKLNLTLMDPTSAWMSYAEQQRPISLSVSIAGSTISGAYTNLIKLDMARVLIEQSPTRFGTTETITYEVQADTAGTTRDHRGTKVTVVISGTV